MVSLSNSFVHDEEEKDLDEVRKAILVVLESVSMDTMANEEGAILLAPTTNTWSRQARRAAQRAAQNPEAEGEATTSRPEASANAEPLFRARLSFEKPEAPVPAATECDAGTGGDGDVALPNARATMEWQWGRDRTIVDAFWKFVIQKAGLRKRKQPAEEGTAEKKIRATADDEEQQANNPYLQHQENPYLGHGQGGGNRGRGRGRDGRRGAFGGGRGRGGYSRPHDQGWARRQ